MGQEVRAMKQKTCKVCRAHFDPRSPMQVVCGPSCAIQHAAKAREKKEKAARVEEKRQDRVKREGMKTIPVLLKAAQKQFNAYIRARDAHLPCISCDAPPPDPSEFHGGRDAGHFRSVGAASHLRFHEDNVHGQCVKCNQFLAGNVVEYRKRLVERIGLPRLEALERAYQPKKWTHQGLIDLAQKYIRLRKELRNGRDKTAWSPTPESSGARDAGLLVPVGHDPDEQARDA